MVSDRVGPTHQGTPYIGIPIIIAAIIWGPMWEGQRVDAYCDNMAVVAAVTSRYCQDATLMQMLWGLFFIEAHYQFKITATHIPGQHNELADNLSRNRLVDFLRKKTGALPTTSNVPVSFLQWLLNPKLEWTSQAWMRQFATFVRNINKQDLSNGIAQVLRILC